MTALLITWIFTLTFAVVGVLNLFLVHPVPGICYLVLAAVYLPQTNQFLKKKFGFTIPLIAMIGVGIVVLWGTLAVGDLAEILGL